MRIAIYCVATLVPVICPAIAQTTVGGAITTDARWIFAGQPYLVTSDVTVSQGATLTIEPAVEVRFAAGLGLSVGTPASAGTLVARGTPTLPIRFTGTVLAPGSWKGIQFTAGAIDAQLDAGGKYVSGSVLERCVIEHAGAGQAAVDCFRSAPLLLGSTVSLSASNGVRFVMPRVEARVEACLVFKAAADGITHKVDAVNWVPYSSFRCVDNVVLFSGAAGIRYEGLRYGYISPHAYRLQGNVVQVCAVGVQISQLGLGDGPGFLIGGAISGCNLGVDMLIGGDTIPRATLEDITIHDNGAGVTINQSGLGSQLLLNRCTVLKNGKHGVMITSAGVMFNDSIVLRNCRLSANGGNGGGGAVTISPPWDGLLMAAPNIRVEDCVFADNTGKDGGALALGGLALIKGSTFAHNRATHGGALHLSRGQGRALGIPHLLGCTFLGNAGGMGDDIYLSSPAGHDAKADTCRFAGPRSQSDPLQIWDGNDDPSLGVVGLNGASAGDPFAGVGHGVAGATGVPQMVASGPLTLASQVRYDVAAAAPLAPGLMLLAASSAYTYAFGGFVLPDLTSAISFPIMTDATGHTQLVLWNIPSLPTRASIYAQACVVDFTTPNGLSLTNGVLGVAR